MIAVDTNILVYAVDANAGMKYTKARDLLARLTGNPIRSVMLWQVIAEFLRYLRRLHDLGAITDQELHEEFAEYRALFSIRLPTEAVLDHALDLAARYSLSHWDSMLLGACLDAGVTTLYTEDMGSPRAIDTIHLVDPLV